MPIDKKLKKEQKSTLYHKDGIIFVDMFRAPDDKYLKQFTPVVLPKGITMTCVNCGKEIKLRSEKWHCLYCAECLRLYPDRPYDMTKEDEKIELQQDWVTTVRPIIPSAKPPDEKPSTPTISSAELDILKKEAQEIQEDLEDIL